jgi:hypothetical protein
MRISILLSCTITHSGSAANALPIAHVPGDDPEQGMRVGDSDFEEGPIPRRRARTQLSLQMPPFVKKLTLGLDHGDETPTTPHLPSIETILPEE